jgi:hypothetical protein
LAESLPAAKELFCVNKNKAIIAIKCFIILKVILLNFNNYL